MAKTAVITGAASGIGEAAARRLLQAGWTVFGLDVNRARLEEVAHRFATLEDGPSQETAQDGAAQDGAAQETAQDGASNRRALRDRFKPVVCDVADATRVVATFAEIAAATPSLDALICCAGVLRSGPMESMAVEEFDLVLNVNTRGTWLCAREALPLLRRAATPDHPSRIVLLSSVAALRPKIMSGAYAASKAAVSQLCRVMAAEWAPSGVLVNALAPGTVDTPMVRAMADPAVGKGYQPSGVSPVGRIAQADDVVDVAMFLLSPAARYVTGTTIPVDGGTQAAFIPPTPSGPR